MAEKLSDNHLTSFATHLDEQHGERGTLAREEFEKESTAFIGMIRQELYGEDNLRHQ